MTALSSQEFLSLASEWYQTFVRKPEEEIAQVIFSEAMRCSNALLSSSFTTQKLANDNGQQLVFELFYLYAHLLNRSAFRLFGNEFRCELQDRLIDILPGSVIDAMFSQCSAQGRSELYETFIAELNGAEVLYGSKPRLVDTEDKLSDGAVLPTFAKRASELLGHRGDPVTIMRVQIMLLDSLKRASFDALIKKAKEA